MITDADITKLKKTFVTKQDLKKELKKELARYATKEDLSITIRELLRFMTEIKNEIKTEITSDLKNEIVLFKDAILFEIKSLREEVVMIGGMRDMVEDHKVRLARLASSGSSASR